MKKSDLKLIIRKIVREEVAMAIQEVITELKQPTQQQISQPKVKKKMVEKKVLVYFSDCPFFAGCENMIPNFLNSDIINFNYLKIFFSSIKEIFLI